MGNDDDPRASTSPSIRLWQKFFRSCFSKGLDTAEITPAFKDLVKRHPLAAPDVAKAVLGLRNMKGFAEPPRLPRYIDLLLRQRLVSPRDLLAELLKQSRYTPGAKPIPDKIAGFPTLEENIFNNLAAAHRKGSVAGLQWRNPYTIGIIGQWLKKIADYESAKQVELGPLHSIDVATFNTYEALTRFAYTVFCNPSFRKVQDASWWKKLRGPTVTRIENLVMHVLSPMQSQLTPQASAITKCPPFIETGPDGLPIFTAQDVQNMITDLPVDNSRAGLYVWLNACLCARPLTDDVAMHGYLQTRYSGNFQALVVDILVAAFDNLANSMLRQESRSQVKLLQSFICNKLPLLFVSVSSSMMPPFTVENCVQMAFTAINMNPVPPMSRDSAGIKDQLQLTRLEFLQACHLHQLISESAISGVLGEPPLALPRVTRHSKESLLAQCNNNMARLESLIEELDGMQGNCGAIAGCVVDSINNMYSSKDTMSLKAVCHALIRKPANLDVLLQYAQPASFLLPLCNILNDWVLDLDQDQSELQPPYEEFASILLFISVVVHRYDLRKDDIGLSGSDNFVARMLEDGSSSIPKDVLTEEQNKQLAKWFEGLYSTDEHGETAGIGDEVMSACPPQAFYTIVPTLFEQSVVACKSKMLNLNTLKGGLEFLLEPFLLPSLIGGLSWLVKHSWEDHADANILLQILDKLLKPSSSSQETQSMHRAVLGIVGKPLDRSLRELVRRRPEKKETAEGLMALLRPFVHQQRILACTRAEMETWNSAADGGISQCLKNHIRSLTSWAAAGEVSAPPEYTHRLFSCAIRGWGANAVLQAIIAELSEQTSIGNGSITMDICTSIVSAPSPDSQPQMNPYSNNATTNAGVRLSLRDALRLETFDHTAVLERPVDQAQALIRLSRRVEAQLAPPQLPQMTLPMAVVDQTTDQILQDLGLGEADMNAAAVATTAGTNAEGDAIMQTSGPDFNSQDVASMMDLNNVSGQDFADMANDAGVGSGDQQESDIFGDLSFDMAEPPQQVDASANLMGDGNMGVSLDGQQQNQNQSMNQEEDIFAGLDMGGLDDFGGDFNFS